MKNNIIPSNVPTKVFRIASIIALIIGLGAYMIGLYNANMALNEKGYYLISLLFALFSVVSLQKSIRDKQEGIKISKAYFLVCICAVALAMILFYIGLSNAKLLLSEIGFYAMAFTLSLFAAVTVQKNVRDCDCVAEQNEPKDSIT